jgi:hypothetical protein
MSLVMIDVFEDDSTCYGPRRLPVLLSTIGRSCKRLREIGQPVMDAEALFENALVDAFRCQQVLRPRGSDDEDPKAERKLANSVPEPSKIELRPT